MNYIGVVDFQLLEKELQEVIVHFWLIARRITIYKAMDIFFALDK